MIRLSIIIPVLNEAASIGQLLAALSGKAKVEIIVVDGGSQDATLALAKQYPCQVLRSPIRGRAAQLNFGARAAKGEILLFLHADTRLPENFVTLVDAAMRESPKVWGRFDVHLSGERLMFRVIETLMNWRSRLSGIATGDQAMFVKRSVFNDVGGFENIPLMEDIALSRALKRVGPPLCLRQRVTTSSRRWEEKGVWRTILLMWRLRLAYYLGASPQELVKQYD